MSGSPGPVKVYVPRDAAALGVGADDTARAIAEEAARRHIDIELIRNGSRGLLWLEPLVEVATLAGRVAYGPVAAHDVASLFDAGFTHGRPHSLAHGRTEELSYLKNQERLTFARVGITDPRSLEDYLAHGGYRGLDVALAMEPAAIVAAVTASGLRGRGGRHFPLASSGRPCWALLRSKNSLFATPMKAIRAPSRIAW